VPDGVKPTILQRAGKIDETLSDTDAQTGRLSGKLAEVPDSKQTKIVEESDELDESARRYLGDTDVDSPATKAVDSFQTADGLSGRRALEALSDTDQEAADVLLKIDDPETQWRFVRAYDSGETDADELATALRRYEELDADEKALARRGLERSGDGGIDLLEARDCNSPCKDYYEIADDIRETDAIDESDATKLSDSLEEAIDNA